MAGMHEIALRAQRSRCPTCGLAPHGYAYPHAVAWLGLRLRITCTACWAVWVISPQLIPKAP